MFPQLGYPPISNGTDSHVPLSLLGADLTAKHCSPGSSCSSPLACLTPCHKQTQLKTCLRDKPKHGCRLGCLGPSGGDPANSSWVREEQDCPTRVSNTWEQLAWLAPSSTPASPGGSATSGKPLCGEYPKEKGSRSHQILAAGMHPPPSTPCMHTRVCVASLGTTLDIPGCLLEGSHRFASSYLVSQQTNWSSKPLSLPLHRGRKALSISPRHRRMLFQEQGFLFLFCCL